MGGRKVALFLDMAHELLQEVKALPPDEQAVFIKELMRFLSDCLTQTVEGSEPVSSRSPCPQFCGRCPFLNRG